MPNYAYHRSRRHATDIPDPTGDVLLWSLVSRGHCGGVLTLDLETLRAIWEAHREKIKAKWQEEALPCTRSFVEWLFHLVPQHGERQIICTDIDLERYRLYGIIHAPEAARVQETEREYLARHGLLRRGEEYERDALDRMHEANHQRQLALCKYDPRSRARRQRQRQRN